MCRLTQSKCGCAMSGKSDMKMSNRDRVRLGFMLALPGLVCLFLIAAKPTYELTASAIPDTRYLMDVTRVVDGDTFDGDIHLPLSVVLKKQRVRLLNVDTWEMFGEHKALGQAAKKYVEGLFDHAEVWLVFDGKRECDNFGRVLATVYVLKDGEWYHLGHELIQLGHGVEDVR